MIHIRFTLDSKRRGQSELAPTLAAAKRVIKCAKPKFTPQKLAGYARAWEVTCGNTVVADAMQVAPRRKRKR